MILELCSSSAVQKKVSIKAAMERFRNAVSKQTTETEATDNLSCLCRKVIYHYLYSHCGFNTMVPIFVKLLCENDD